MIRLLIAADPRRWQYTASRRMKLCALPIDRLRSIIGLRCYKFYASISESSKAVAFPKKMPKIEILIVDDH
jgi:hypothetical protein